MASNQRSNVSYNGLDMTTEKIPTETNKRIINNTLLYPIAKAYFEEHKPFDDIIRTYDRALEDVDPIIREDNIVTEYIQLNNTVTVKFVLHFDRMRIYTPDSIESKNFSVQGFNPYPCRALATKGTYSVCCVADTVYKCYSYNVINGQTELSTEQLVFEERIPDSYYFNFPIPVMSKYCSLRRYDEQTLLQSGEERALAGFFVIEGFIRYIINIDRKPLNHELIQRNLYDNQLSRCEAIYTKGFDYEKSYYVVASMVQPKQAHIGRSGRVYSPSDFVFSLQLNDKAMNIDTNYSKRSHALINAVPMRFMFYAFGCRNDEDILRYVCPAMDNFSLIQTIRNACLNGFVHKEALENASIRTTTFKDQTLIDEPLTKFLALYIIGSLILNPTFKQTVLDKCRKSTDNTKADKDVTAEYRRRIALKTLEILNERFMPGIGMYDEKSSSDPSSVSSNAFNRDHAVCTELGYIVRELYMIGNRFEGSQDKTSMVNKRIRAGQQIEREFSSFHGKRLQEIMEEVRKVFISSTNLSVAKSVLQNKMRNIVINAGKAMSSSLLNSFKQTSREQSKLRTELLAHKNELFMDNVLREIVKTPSTQAKGSDVSWEHRQAHLSELFFIDPVMTPEAGKQVGRFKSPTLFTGITLSTNGKQEAAYIGTFKTFIKNIYNKDGNVLINPAELYNIKLNGSIIGYVRRYNDVDDMYHKLMEARRTGEIQRDCSVILNHNATLLSIWTDTGRLMSPFVKVSSCFDLKSSIEGDKVKTHIIVKPEFKRWLSQCSTTINQYNRGIDDGFMELADPEMVINNMVIAGSIRDFYKKPLMYTHIALPLSVYSTVCAVVPGINLNKSLRGSLITNHVKQMIGPTTRVPQIKFKDEQHFTIAPQVPVTRPCIYDYRHQGEKPYGQTLIVAFMYYKYNQEDCIVVNKASVESGMLEIDTTMTFTSEINRDEEFKMPENTTLHGNPDSYHKIDPSTCLPKRVSERFHQKDALITKVVKTPYGTSDATTINEQPDARYMKTPDGRLLRAVLKMKQQDENKIVKMSVFGQYQPLIVGDKTNFETAQKNTIGRIVSPGEMPYTASGIRPDVIFNPISIFKRVTCAQEYMPMVTKIATLMGCPLDVTPFHTQRSSEELCAIMNQIGMHESGEEIMYDPETRRPYKAKIFIGNAYMGRQPHIVERKMNVRNGGPRSIDTQQPSKGRKRAGGQSIDRMGNDDLFAAGINLVNRDAHLARGSSTKIGICNRCHSVKGYYHDQRKCWICPQCGAHEDMLIKELPVASSMIAHIFNAMHLNLEYYENGNGGDLYDKYPQPEHKDIGQINCDVGNIA